MEGLPGPGRVCTTHKVAPHRAKPEPGPTICSQPHVRINHLPQLRALLNRQTVGSRLVFLGVTEQGPKWEAGKTWQNALPFLGHLGRLSTS